MSISEDKTVFLVQPQGASSMASRCIVVAYLCLVSRTVPSCSIITRYALLLSCKQAVITVNGAVHSILNDLLINMKGLKAQASEVT